MTRNRPRLRILAIDPGTRLMGVAVLDGTGLVYHGVETLPWHVSPHSRLAEARRVVLRFLHDFRPEVLAVEKAFFAQNRNTALLNVLVDEIRALGAARGIPVRALAPATVKKRLTGDGGAGKRDVARAAVRRFPELSVYLGQDRKWKERYHGNMFDAVAIGLAVRESLEPSEYRRLPTPR